MQKEFRKVVSIEEAERRLYRFYKPKRKTEKVSLDRAHGRVLARDIVANIDVPPFDRAAMDGYAVRAKDTFYADEEHPVELKIKGYIAAGDSKRIEIGEKECVGIATGAPLPKGANAVVMVEFTEREGRKVKVYRPVAPGENVMPAGSDIMRGELVIRKGTLLSPRETALLASLGLSEVEVYGKPKVAIISTGNEIISPGKKLEFGKIYDINARALYDEVIENGGAPTFLGIVEDDPDKLREKIKRALDSFDVILTSGGTSAGVGDISYRIIDELGDPGVIVHGVAIKPGKPTVIGVVNGKPIFGLPGYPTSCLIIFNVFVAPLLRNLSGLPERKRKKIKARTSMRIYSAKGRREYVLVNLVGGYDGSYSAYPILSGSGAITTLAYADGYIEVPERVEYIDKDEAVNVTLLSDSIRLAELTIIGSHCIGVDIALSLLGPLQSKVINVGSSGGLMAAKRGECDIAGCHLVDENGEYNIPFIRKFGLENKVYLVRGYRREQGFVIASGNPKGIRGIEDILRDDVSFINRNAGSGTRILFDLELQKLAKDMGEKLENLTRRIKGYEIEAKTHSAVAAAVAYGRADVGLAIRTVAEQYGLDFIPIKDEQYDFVIPKEKYEKNSVQRFLKVLKSEEFRDKLSEIPGLIPTDETGNIIHFPE